MPENNALLSTTTYFWLFFCKANFSQLDHTSVDSFCFPFGESNLECPGIRKDYSNISTGKLRILMKGRWRWTNGPKKEDLFPKPCRV